MRILEVEGDPTDTTGVNIGKLVALVKFLMGRAKDTRSPERISLQAFLSIANSLNVGVTKENLQRLVSAENQDTEAAVLKNYIANVTPTEVIFKGAENTAGATGLKPEQSQNIVAQMAKRAL